MDAHGSVEDYYVEQVLDNGHKELLRVQIEPYENSEEVE